MTLKTPTSLLKYVAGVLLLAAVTASAQDASPTGTWTWVTPGRNGGAGRTNTLTLKVEDTKLTGKVAAPGRGGAVTETPITDGKVEAKTVSFNVVRENNGNSTTNKYSGTISGDKITGKIEFNHDGEAQSRDWKADRSTETK